MREYKVRLGPEEAYTALELEEQEADTAAFLDAMVVDEDKEKLEKQKRKERWHRLSTFDLLCGMEWQMNAFLHHGFVFAATTPESLLLPINTRQRITLCWDMGPDNLRATFYLLNFKKLRISAFFSVVHKCQRALWGGMQLSGKYSLVLLGCQLANCERGPWDGAGKRTSFLESARDLKNNVCKVSHR